MSIGATGTYLIPACSWCGAQEHPFDRSQIIQVVVEELAFEFRDIQSCNFMNNAPVGMNPILVYGWH